MEEARGLSGREDDGSTHAVAAEPRPNTLVPRQLFGGSRYGISRQPEKPLLLAVLREAITTLIQYRSASSERGRHQFALAEQWLMSQARSEPFDFENICAALDLEPSYLRACLAREGVRPAMSRVVQLARLLGFGGTRRVSRSPDRPAATFFAGWLWTRPPAVGGTGGLPPPLRR